MNPYYHDERSGITIYHADCREVLPILEPVDLVLTDPPYGLGDRWQGGGWSTKEKFDIVRDWDAAPTSDDLIKLVINHAKQSIVWGGNYYSLPPSRGWLIWHKPDSPPTLADAELAWTNRDMNTRIIRHSIAATNAERVGHPSQKPLPVMIWCLSLYPNAITILDPFMGSGTSLVAAKQLGRRAIGIETEERYCEIAVKRLEQECLFCPEVLSTSEELQEALPI